MKKLVKYFLILLLGIYLIPFVTASYKLLTYQKNINDCMITYVKNIKYNGYKKGYWTYDHIDIKKYLGDKEIGKVKGCLFYGNKDNYLNYSNTIYCSLSYLIL